MKEAEVITWPLPKAGRTFREQLKEEEAARQALDQKTAANVVVVNDDLVQLSMISTFLVKEKLTVHAFLNAEEALAKLAAGLAPDLIITDLYMPGIDGWRFCRLLRSPEYAAFNKIPILVISATFSGEHAHRITSELGANAFIPAPIDAGRLKQQVHALLAGEILPALTGVLIVEDDPNLSKILRESFTSHGFEVYCAANGKEAKSRFRFHTPDMVVIDYHLPDTPGDRLLMEFKRANPLAVVVMMTGDASPGLAMQFMREGAAAYVHKPFTADYLITLCLQASRERALVNAEDLLEVRTRELRESEAKFRTLAESIQAVLFIRVGNQFRYVNPALEQISGYNRSELLSMDVEKIIHPDFRALAEAQFRARGRGEAVSQYELKIVARNGEARWVEVTDALLVFEDQKATIGTAFDITERKRAEEALKTTSSRLMALMENLQSGVLFEDENQRILYVNSRFCELFNLAGPRLAWVDQDGTEAGRQCSKLFAQPEQFLQRLQEIERGQYTIVNEEILLADGRIFERSYVPVLVDGQHRGHLWQYNDVTERKRAEQTKVTLEAQLRQSQKMEAVGQLAAGVAHDFNNILTVILGHADMLQPVLGPEAKKSGSLDLIKSSAERAANLVRQLLTFSRKQPLQPKTLDLNTIITNLVSMLERLLGEQIVLQCHYGGSLPAIRADESMIEQIILNLAVNARDAMPNGGQLTVTTTAVEIDTPYIAKKPQARLGKFVCLTVEDNGEGMDTGTLGRIFEPFFTTKEVGKGTGLGLATVYGIVAQHEGWIEVSSQLGDGTTFKVFIPGYDAIVPAARNSVSVSENLNGQETVMVVEDEPAVRMMVRTILKRYGYHVLEASDGVDALRVWQQEQGKVDLLLTDMVMPKGISGRDLAEKLLAEKAELKVIYTSGYSVDFVRQNQDLREGSRFLAKPYAPKLLAQTVRACLDEHDVTDQHE